MDTSYILFKPAQKNDWKAKIIINGTLITSEIGFIDKDVASTYAIGFIEGVKWCKEIASITINNEIVE